MPQALPGWPRALKLELDTAYCGLSRNTFLREVDAGRAPAARRLTAGRKVWLREELDAWLDRAAGKSRDEADDFVRLLGGENAA